MYKDKEIKELLELVDGHKSLTFQSQLYLQEELNARGLSKEVAVLDSTIAKTSSNIKNFHFLKDLGFKVEDVGNSFKVKRTTNAILTDMAAIVLGLLLSMYGFVKLLSITVLAPENEADFSINSVITLIVYGVMILIGVKFLNGVKRFLDFLGFELSKSDTEIILKKRFDLKLEERSVEASSFQLERRKDRMILKVNDDSLLDSNANDIIQKMTIESLYKRLRS
ncbi:hypothetical protein [Maribacter sp. 2308TA10-17]|uniref:hypothetical protein n=1 Tax=Maribacter sp. 2308TA10-17 TaxID=3386276 RepID=UPI0039BC78F5